MCDGETRPFTLYGADGYDLETFDSIQQDAVQTPTINGLSFASIH